MSASDAPSQAVSDRVAAIIKAHGLKPGDARFIEDEHVAMHNRKMAALAAKEAERSQLRYSDDQPRDEHGRFADTGASHDSSGDSGGSKGGGGSSSGGGPSATQVIEAAKAGGGTFDPVTGVEPTTGYVVAFPDRSSITPADEFFSGEPGQEKGIEVYDQFLKDNADILSQPGAHVGVWNDTEHNEIVLDPTEVVADREQAIALGVERNQQAIYDLVSGLEIPTGGTGGRTDEEATRSREALQARERDDGRGAPGAGDGAFPHHRASDPDGGRGHNGVTWRQR